MIIINVGVLEGAESDGGHCEVCYLMDVIFRITTRCLYDPLSGYLYNLSSATRAEGRTRHLRSHISVNSFVLSIKAQRKEKLILENQPIASEWSLVAEQPEALFTKLSVLFMNNKMILVMIVSYNVSLYPICCE